MVRNPGWYFFTIFGTPSKTGKWGWRVEGHHLSLNFTMEGTQVVASTPCFFGANPALVMNGADKGKRILPQAEDHARDLFKSLNADQMKIALKDKPFGEPGQKTKTPKLGTAVGLSASKMTKEQNAILYKLVQSYTWSALLQATSPPWNGSRSRTAVSTTSTSASPAPRRDPARASPIASRGRRS